MDVVYILGRLIITIFYLLSMISGHEIGSSKTHDNFQRRGTPTTKPPRLSSDWTKQTIFCQVKSLLTILNMKSFINWQLQWGSLFTELFNTYCIVHYSDRSKDNKLSSAWVYLCLKLKLLHICTVWEMQCTVLKEWLL